MKWIEKPVTVESPEQTGNYAADACFVRAMCALKDPVPRED